MRCNNIKKPIKIIVLCLIMFLIIQAFLVYFSRPWVKTNEMILFANTTRCTDDMFASGLKIVDNDILSQDVYRKQNTKYKIVKLRLNKITFLVNIKQTIIDWDSKEMIYENEAVKEISWEFSNFRWNAIGIK